MNKPKLIEVTDPKELTALALTASLDKPFMFSNRVGALTHFWAWLSDAFFSLLPCWESGL